MIDLKKRETRGWLIPFSLFGLALLAFSNSFPGSFIGDDISIVRNNPLVETIDLKAIFTSDYWGPEANSGLFRPLTILSFGINRLLLGPSPAAFHLVNVLLHGLVTVMLYLMLKRQAAMARMAWFAAALFAVHPIHTEVVNEAVGRAELLAALGILSALWCCGFKRSAGAWTMVGIAYLAALLSKEHAVVLLPMLMLLDKLAGRWRRGEWREVFPLYGLLGGISGLWLAWRIWGVERAVPPDTRDLVYTPLAFLSPGDRVTSALAIQWDYLWKQLFPIKLQGIYSGATFFQPVPIDSTVGITVLAATLGLMSWALWSWSRSLPGGTIVLAYALAFLPVSNLLFATGVTLAERLAYLPSAWFCTGLAALFIRLNDRLPYSRLVKGAAVATLVIYLAATLARNPAFSSPRNLWQADVKTDPKNVLAWMYLANTYATLDQIAQADDAYRFMLELAPDFPEGLGNYAEFLLRQGRYDEAIVYGLRLAADTTGWNPHNAMVIAQAYCQKGNYAEALSWLEVARPLFQNYAIYWEYRGKALEGLGQLTRAVESYRRMGGYPEGSDVPLRLGNLLLQLQRPREAVEVLLAKSERNPEAAPVWNSLGIAQSLAGEKGAAEQSFRRAVSLAPDNPNYRANLRRVTESD